MSTTDFDKQEVQELLHMFKTTTNPYFESLVRGNLSEEERKTLIVQIYRVLEPYLPPRQRQQYTERFEAIGL